MKPFTSAGVTEAVSYAASHGICVARSKTSPPGTNLSHAPLTYYPSPVPRKCYDHGIRITPTLNHLLTCISDDSAYLRSVLKEAAHADAQFTGRLLQIMPDKVVGKVSLSIFRYDYFVHDDQHAPSLKMVEMNCIASSFGCLATKTSEMHRFLATHPAVGWDIDMEALPKNDALGGVAGGIATAHEQYCKLYGEGCVVMMVGQEGERNAYDQYLLKLELWEKFNVEMVRFSLAQIYESGSVKNGELYMGERRVSVVYFRAGYTPDDYHGEREWKAREMIEKSESVKCPSVAMQLVGTKKVQQVLDKEGEVERFVEEGAKDVRATFVRQYALDNDEVVKMGIERKSDFVLKPQREGGGNNLYGDEMQKKLMGMDEEERKAYVLMERIRPVVTKNVLVREGEARECDVVSEFGVYGIHVGVEGKAVVNAKGGVLLRSKQADVDDGGVAAGVAVLDSPLLVE